VLKNCASRRDPALCGFCKCSHIDEYAALSKTPHALADGLILVLQHPVTKKTPAPGTGAGIGETMATVKKLRMIEVDPIVPLHLSSCCSSVSSRGFSP
jgi:hypothetical protein